jgi:putative transposase
MRSPIGRRRLLKLGQDRGLSARAACRLLGLSRTVACYRLQQPEKDRPYADRLIATSQQFPRFGYRRMAVWLSLSEKRVRRLWSQLKLQLPAARPQAPARHRRSPAGRAAAEQRVDL